MLDKAELVELRARQRTYEGAYQRTALLMLGQGAVVLKVFDKRFFSSEFSVCTAQVVRAPDHPPITPSLTSFSQVGILYAAVSILLLVICEIRRKQSNRSFSDAYPDRYDGEATLHPTPPSPPVHNAPAASDPSESPVPTSQPDERSPLKTDPRPLPSSIPLPPSPEGSPSSSSRRPSPSSHSLSHTPLPPHSPPLTSSPKAEASADPSLPRHPSTIDPSSSKTKPDPSERVFGAPFVTASGVVLLFTTVVGLMEVALLVLVVLF